MKHARFFTLLLALSPLASFAQSIASVTPSSGPASGGNDVVITGSGLGLPPNFSCVLPCPAKVAFGGVEVIVKDERDTRLVATAPAHSPGTVEIRVTTGDGRIAFAPNAYTYLADSPEAIYERLLLPVYLDGTVPGAKGSLWKTDFWIRNGGPGPVRLAPWPCEGTTPCPPVVPWTYTLEAGETKHNLAPEFRPPTNNPARMLFVERNRGDVSTNLRVLDTSRAGLNAGTELPVVRDAEIGTAPITLLNVPADARFRQHLRIYDVASDQARFSVRLYDNRAGMASAPLIHEVQVTASTNETGPFRVRPAYAEVPNLQDLLPIYLPGAAPTSLRVEIQPLTQGSRFWAFVSVTNNDTQMVTLVTP